MGQVPGGRRWRKSSHSNPSGSCVELSRLATGEVAVRNSRDPDGASLVFSGAQIAALIADVKQGEWDELLADPSNVPTNQ